METKRKHPGVYIPPPLIYALVFLLSLLLQRLFVISPSFFNTRPAHILGWITIAFSQILVLPAITGFIQSRNTLITVKPANSLQRKGLYSFTRNPMYLGLIFLYTGTAFFVGNWWSFILIPMLIVLMTVYVIKREEKYLADAFGQDYTAYKISVRRWI